MSNEVQLFEFDHLPGEVVRVRVVVIDNDPWFVAKDVTDALGFKNGKDAVRQHVLPGQKRGSQITTPGGPQTFTVIHEQGLYRLIMKSTLMSAIRFQAWITDEVLPTIRKTGGAYVAPGSQAELDLLDDPIAAFERVLEVAKAERAKRVQAENYIEENKGNTEIGSRWVEEADGELLTVRETARRFQIREKDFKEMLRDWGWIELNTTKAKAYAIQQQYMQNKVYFPYYPDLTNGIATGKFTVKGIERLATKLAQ